EPLDTVARLLERFAQRGAGEEMRVRAVEEATVGVAPPAGEEREADRPVGDVRRREDETAALLQQRTQPRERGHRVAEVLDDVPAEHDVERAWLERQLHRLDVADEHALAVRLGADRGGGIELDADDRVAPLRSE